MTIDDFLDYISEYNPDACYPTSFKDAIIGIVERLNMEPLILLDRSKCLKILSESMTMEEAEEYFEYNVIGAWVGDGTPCYATLLEDINA